MFFQTTTSSKSRDEIGDSIDGVDPMPNPTFLSGAQRSLSNFHASLPLPLPYPSPHSELIVSLSFISSIQCHFGCGISKMVGPYKHDFWPKINNHTT